MGANVNQVLSTALWQEFTKHRPKCVLVDDVQSLENTPAEKRSSKHKWNVYTPNEFDATYIAWRAVDVALFLCVYTPEIDDEIFLYTYLTDHPWDNENRKMWVFEIHMPGRHELAGVFHGCCKH
jgi:hypothetical protein